MSDSNIENFLLVLRNKLLLEQVTSTKSSPVEASLTIEWGIVWKVCMLNITDTDTLPPLMGVVTQHWT